MDLVQRSGGVVLTITDIHETGAIAQRLKNEQSAGAWITVPRQFDLPCGEEPAKALASRLSGEVNTEDVWDSRVDYYEEARKTLSPGVRLQWKPSQQDLGGLPGAGKNLVVMADVGGVLHFRVFDDDGRVVKDIDETMLVERARQSGNLEKNQRDASRSTTSGTTSGQCFGTVNQKSLHSGCAVPGGMASQLHCQRLLICRPLKPKTTS